MAKTLKSIEELMEELREGKVQVTVVRKTIQPVHFQQLVSKATAIEGTADRIHTAEFWMAVERFGLTLDQGIEILRGVERLKETNGKER